MQQGESGTRLFYLDNLRASIVILVILHHIALVYGNVAPFYYQEFPVNDPAAGLLGAFALVNQAWFMGALFFVAGYFSPAAVSRHGPGAFVSKRLVRLGIPILVGLFVIEPVSRLSTFLMPSQITGITRGPIWSDYPNLIGLGVFWFVVLLLIFCIGFALWVRFVERREPDRPEQPKFPNAGIVGLFILVLAGVSFLMRMVVPMGMEVHLLVKYLNFPTIAYLPQYLGLFVLGIAAYRRRWLEALPGWYAWAGLGVAIVATIFLFPLALGAPATGTPPIPPFLGRGTWPSAVYTLWDSILAVCLGLALLAIFRRFLDRNGKLWQFLAGNSYAVYLIHVPIVVYTAYLLRGVSLTALPKFALAALIMVPLCFVAAYLLRRIPLVAKVV